MIGIEYEDVVTCTIVVIKVGVGRERNVSLASWGSNERKPIESTVMMMMIIIIAVWQRSPSRHYINLDTPFFLFL